MVRTLEIKSIFFFFLKYFMCMIVILHEYMCTMCILGWGGQMRVSYPMELALQMVVNLHAGAGN